MLLCLCAVFTRAQTVGAPTGGVVGSGVGAAGVGAAGAGVSGARGITSTPSLSGGVTLGGGYGTTSSGGADGSREDEAKFFPTNVDLNQASDDELLRMLDDGVKKRLHGLTWGKR